MFMLDTRGKMLANLFILAVFATVARSTPPFMFPVPPRPFGAFPPVLPVDPFMGSFVPGQFLPPLPPPLPEPLPLPFLGNLPPPPLPLQIVPVQKYFRPPVQNYFRPPPISMAPPRRRLRQRTFLPAFRAEPRPFQGGPSRHSRSFMNMPMRRLYDDYSSDQLEDIRERNRERFENVFDNYEREEGDSNERLDARLDQYSDYRDGRFGSRNKNNFGRSKARSDLLDARRDATENRIEARADRIEAVNEFRAERLENMNEQRSEMREDMLEQMEEDGGFPVFAGRSRQLLSEGYYKS